MSNDDRSDRTIRLLVLSASPFFVPDEIPTRDQYSFLSKRFRGDILAVVHQKSLRARKLDRFILHGLLLPTRIRYLTWARGILFSLFAVASALRLHYWGHGFDVVVAREPFVAGLIAVGVRVLTGVPFVVEVNGNFESAFTQDSRRVGPLARLKERCARAIGPFVLRRASKVKLLYDDQLRGFADGAVGLELSVFPDFVPISHFYDAPVSPPYILFMGSPWHLKGVDVLIKAFNRISSDYPDWTLRIVGFCTDKEPFLALAGGNRMIELCEPVWYADVVKLMAGCSLFVLPSRTEAMGRVLIEAMASHKPVIGSKVDGIPYVIQHGRNGLLFESENVDDLAATMRRILDDPAFAERLGAEANAFVRSHFSEDEYLRHFACMIDQVIPSEACRHAPTLSG
jgi:glycosyltransferase involved in cell wall biosynthesis